MENKENKRWVDDWAGDYGVLLSFDGNTNDSNNITNREWVNSMTIGVDGDNYGFITDNSLIDPKYGIKYKYYNFDKIVFTKQIEIAPADYNDINYLIDYGVGHGLSGTISWTDEDHYLIQRDIVLNNMKNYWNDYEWKELSYDPATGITLYEFTHTLEIALPDGYSIITEDDWQSGEIVNAVLHSTEYPYSDTVNFDTLHTGEEGRLCLSFESPYEDIWKVKVSEFNYIVNEDTETYSWDLNGTYHKVEQVKIQLQKLFAGRLIFYGENDGYLYFIDVKLVINEQGTGKYRTVTLPNSALGFWFDVRKNDIKNILTVNDLMINSTHLSTVSYEYNYSEIDFAIQGTTTDPDGGGTK